MKLNLNFEYDKLHLKEVVILIPKYHPNMVSFLTPVLGLYGINVKEFINEFNIKTRFVKFDIIVPVRVRISKIKTFEILVKTPYVSTIVSNLPSFSHSKLSLLSIYKISLIKSVSGNFFMFSFQKKVYYALRQYLSLISHSGSLIRLKPSFISTSLPFSENVFMFNSSSKIWNVLNLFDKSPYGFFLTFNSSNCSKINYLVNSLGLVGLHIKKIPSIFFSLFLLSQKLYGNIYYIGSNHFGNFSHVSGLLLNSRPTSGFFLNYFRFNNNLFSINFLQQFLRSQSRLNTPVILLKVIKILNINIAKLLSKNFFKIIYLLKTHYANLSSNIT